MRGRGIRKQQQMNHSTLSIKSTGCHRAGSVIVITLLTLAILSVIAAGTLSVVSSKYNSTFQASSWQESLQGAEAGVDIAMAALNDGSSWTGWNQVNSSPPPRSAPSGSFATPTARPSPGQYYFYQPPALTHVGEGNNTIKMFVTVDTGGMSGLWYRIRSTGTTDIAGTPRASSEKLDNNLRKLSLFTDRITGGSLVATNKGHAQRTVELIAQPVFPNSPYANGLTTAGAIILPGQGSPALIDSFDSSNFSKSGNGGLYDPSKAQHNAKVAMLNAAGSDFNGTPVYGNVTYSTTGAAPKNLNVSGTVASPYNTVIPPVTDPSGTFIPLPPTTGGVPVLAGTQANPAQYKVTGNLDLTPNSGQTMTFTKVNPNNKDNKVILWVTGNIILPKNAITVPDGVQLVIYGDKNFTLSGGAFNNQNTFATNQAPPASTLTIYGTAPMINGAPSGTMYIGPDVGSGDSMVGVIDAPGYNLTMETHSSFSGAITAGKASVISKDGLHFDERLIGWQPPPSSYAYASWFEDTR